MVLVKPMSLQQTASLLQTMETSFQQRQFSAKKRLGTMINTNMQQVMQRKPSAKTPKAEQQCTHPESGTTWTSNYLKQLV